MTETLVLLEVPGGAIALTPEALTDARRRAREVAGFPATGEEHGHPPEGLLDAEALARALSLPVSWVETATREGRIPHRQFGRWRRYALTEVLACPAYRARMK